MESTAETIYSIGNDPLMFVSTVVMVLTAPAVSVINTAIELSSFSDPPPSTPDSPPDDEDTFFLHLSDKLKAVLLVLFGAGGIISYVSITYHMSKKVIGSDGVERAANWPILLHCLINASYCVVIGGLALVLTACGKIKTPKLGVTLYFVAPALLDVLAFGFWLGMRCMLAFAPVLLVDATSLTMALISWKKNVERATKIKILYVLGAITTDIAQWLVFGNAVKNGGEDVTVLKAVGAWILFICAQGIGLYKSVILRRTRADHNVPVPYATCLKGGWCAVFYAIFLVIANYIPGEVFPAPGHVLESTPETLFSIGNNTLMIVSTVVMVLTAPIVSVINTAIDEDLGISDRAAIVAGFSAVAKFITLSLLMPMKTNALALSGFALITLGSIIYTTFGTRFLTLWDERLKHT